MLIMSSKVILVLFVCFLVDVLMSSEMVVERIVGVSGKFIYKLVIFLWLRVVCRNDFDCFFNKYIFIKDIIL